MKHAGSADLALMGGSIPSWLFDRMVRLSRPIVEAIVLEYGQKAFLGRMSDPFWFQSFGAVIGMDWNSSGVTTAVMSALKQSLRPQAKELGIYICGGKGKDSMQTPAELLNIGDQTGLDGAYLAKCSRLSAKVDNTAIQDGFQIYLHSFILSAQGGLGPRTLQSLTLVSEVIHGTPSRFSDPARFAFAHGGKTGRPFPVPTHVYDETITTLTNAVEKAKIGDDDKTKAIKKLTELAQQAEPGFTPNDQFDAYLQKERNDAWKYGGRTVKGFSKKEGESGQLSLF